KMAESWMDAAGRDGIPSAFLVDTTGMIAWIGHPMELKDKVIDDVLAGKYDLKQAIADDKLARENEGKLTSIGMELNKAVQKQDWDGAMAKLDEIEKLLPEGGRSGVDRVRLNILFSKKDYPAAYKLAAKMGDANKDDFQVQNDIAWRIASDPGIE